MALLFCGYNLCYMYCYFPCWMSCTLTSALPAVSVQCPIWLFCEGSWRRTFPLCCSGTVWEILRSLSYALCFYCKVFIFWNLFDAFFITFLSSETAMFFPIFFFLLSRNMMSGLLLEMVLSVCTCWFHNIGTLLSRLFFKDFGTSRHQWPLYNFICISFHMVKCSWGHTVIYYYYYYYYYHYYHHHHHRISHFSALAGKYSLILGCNNQQD